MVSNQKEIRDWQREPGSEHLVNTTKFMFECIKNSDCTTGFCNEGVCRKPNLHDPCRGSSCPIGMACNQRSQRCEYEASIASKESNCKFANDCQAGHFCDDAGICRKAPGVGGMCDHQVGCEDGASCHDNICLKLCDLSGNSRFKCGSGEKCSRLLSSDLTNVYGLCEKKPEVQTSKPKQPKKMKPPVTSKDKTPGEDEPPKEVEPSVEVEPPVAVKVEPNASDEKLNPTPSSAPELKFYQNPIFIGGAIAVAVLLSVLVTFLCVKRCGKKPKKEVTSNSYLGPSLTPPPPYPMDALQTSMISSKDKKQ